MSAMIEACRPPAHLRSEGRPGRFEELFLPPKWAFVARIVMPNLLEACAKRDALVATLDLMEIAFRLEEHRRETGAYPPSLDPLTDVPAVDPWSGGEGIEFTRSEDSLGDRWKDAGPWFVLLLLPLALVGFRRGLFFVAPLVLANGLLLAPQAEADYLRIERSIAL